MSTTVVLDAGALDAQGGGPRDVERVVVTCQVSPQRRDALAKRFPGAEIVAVWPATDGPWQTDVERDLERVVASGTSFEGVMLGEVFRASWRESLATVRALGWALRGARRVVAGRGSPAAAILEVARGLGALDEVADLAISPGSAPEGPASPGLLRRVRRAGSRGVALALASRLDPSHVRRSRMRLSGRCAPADALLTASYANPARAALEAWEGSGGGPAVLLETGPGTRAGVRLPAEVRPLALSAALALDRARARAAQRDALPVAQGALDRLLEDPDPFGPRAVLRGTSFGRALRSVLLPEVLSTVAAIRTLVQRTGARRLVVGDEFAFCDRAAVLAARALSLPTVSRQHGVLDSHYLRDRLLCDVHYAWDERTAQWLAGRGATGSSRVEVLARRPPPLAARGSSRAVVVFLQPLEMVHVPTADWMRETLPVVVRASAAAGLSVVLKAHPLQTQAGVLEDVPAALRPSVHVVAGATARDLLADAAVAVTLDSSVCVDCRDADVECLSTAWYEGTYSRELANLGWVVPCATPLELEAAILAHARGG